MNDSLKNILITGAAGGIGRAITQVLLEKGYKVLATDVNSKGLKESLQDHPNLYVCYCDVTDYRSINDLFAFCEDKGLVIGALVYCTGIYQTFPVTEAEPELFERIMKVNLIGAQALIREFLPHLIATRGRVVILSSESFRLPALFQPYMITKAALESFAATARQELMLKGIKLIIIRPGAVDTPLLEWMNRVPDSDKNSVYKEELKKSHKTSVNMVDRPAPPGKVASLIYLAISSGSPKKVYNINHSLRLRILGMIPTGIRERFIAKMIKTPAR